MGANDVREQLEVAIEECGRLERELGEALAVIERVRVVFRMQCPPNRSDFPVGPEGDGSFVAHRWWSTVLGGELAKAPADALAAHDRRARAKEFAEREGLVLRARTVEEQRDRAFKALLDLGMAREVLAIREGRA